MVLRPSNSPSFWSLANAMNDDAVWALENIGSIADTAIPSLTEKI
jgi:hypothetical protein